MQDHNSEMPLALVLGATGGIGGAMARRLSSRGYRVRTMHRNAGAMTQQYPQCDWVQGDAMNGADVLMAAKGASVIVHGVNPPGYRNWGQLVLPMIDNTIAAAKSVGALIVLPGTVYNFGPDAFPVLTEDSPQHPVSVKGGIRVALEQRLEAAAKQGTPVLIVRAGDYFGPGAGNTWFAQGLVKPGAPVNSVSNPGKKGVGHQWAYLPDVAETIMQLIERAGSLPRFARFHMDGFFDTDGGQMAATIARVTGQPGLKIKNFPWWLVRLAAPFVPTFREMAEMRYLWQSPIRMDNARLVAEIGTEPQTPIDQAVREALVSLGCLDRDVSRPDTALQAAKLMDGRPA
ncbi:MAG: NAD-dependent epimerase/dehydratase family protein [Allorhizobium sp.]